MTTTVDSLVANYLVRLDRAASDLPPDRRSELLEIAAVLLLGLGALVVPVVPLLVGLALACASRQWSVAIKVAAAGLVFLPALVLSAFYLSGGDVRPPGIEGVFGIYAFGPVCGLLAAVLLAVDLARRPAARIG